jgi:hypothetical protein
MWSHASVFTLSIHADYQCRHSGACCTAGWRIPVDAAGEQVLAAAASEGRLAHAELDRGDGIAVLPLADSGACVFYRADAALADGRCAVHRALGHEALPLACRQFPRASLVDPRGTFVTLSHFCPTAAAQLFRDDVPLDIVENGPAFPAAAEYVGLDAREALPPLLRPGMLCDLDGLAAWEACGVQLFAQQAWSAEEALDRLTSATERIRGWRPEDGSLAGRVRRAFAGANDGPAEEAPHRNSRGRHLALVNSCLHDGSRPRTLVAAHRDVDACLVAPEWPEFAGAVRRYLATRLFGSWLAYEGRGLRTIVRSLEASLSILRIECGRACAAAGRPLNRALLTQAFRQTDLLLVHEMDSRPFARRLSAGEEGIGLRA